jgi:hypothetical protein
MILLRKNKKNHNVSFDRKKIIKSPGSVTEIEQSESYEAD